MLHWVKKIINEQDQIAHTGRKPMTKCIHQTNKMIILREKVQNKQNKIKRKSHWVGRDVCQENLQW